MIHANSYYPGIPVLKGCTNMNFTKKIAAVFLALTLAAGSMGVYAAKGTTPGYKLVNVYDAEKGIITADIYVTDGYGAVGQLGLHYDTELLDLGATVSGVVTTEYDISTLSLTNFVKSTLSIVTATAETNKVKDLVNEEEGEVYFAWYSSASGNVDARSENKRILTLNFVVAEGVDVTDLEASGTDLIKFANDTPSDTDVKAYKSGVYCANEKTEQFRNSENAKNRIYLSVEFVDLDIEEGVQIVVITVVDAEGNPVEGAYVKIGSETKTSNSNGKVVFEVPGEDYAIYYKHTANDEFMTLREGTTVVISAPEKMTTPTVSAGKNKLTVIWEKPEMTGGSNITGYVVSYTKAGGAEQISEVAGGDVTRLVLEGLEGGTQYSVKVKAVNAIGEGEYSDVKTATPTAPSDPPAGGGSAAPEVLNYVVTYEVGTNGIITSGSKTESVKSGAKPTKVPTVKANEGYEFVGWTTKDGATVDPTTVVIKATTTFYAKYRSTAVVNPFVDIKEEDWYYNSVTEAYKRGLMNGVSETEFAPTGNVTRAMFVTVLYRMEGSPDNSGNEKFGDVESGSWYDKAVAWGSANGIVNGISDTEFAPNNNITREQMAAMVYRYATYKKADMTTLADIGAYEDYTAVSGYAVEAMKWVCGRGIINGMTATTLVPGGISNRAQAATVFVRAQDSLSK